MYPNQTCCAVLTLHILQRNSGVFIHLLKSTQRELPTEQAALQRSHIYSSSIVEGPALRKDLWKALLQEEQRRPNCRQEEKSWGDREGKLVGLVLRRSKADTLQM